MKITLSGGRYRQVANQWNTRQRDIGTNKMHVARNNHFSLRGNEEGGGMKIADLFREQ